MFSDASWKKLTAILLNQKWVFQPLPPLFSKKRPKKAGETEGGKIIFLSRERKMIFLPSLCSTFFFPGKEKWFFFPLFEFFLFFFPGKEKSCFGPFGLFLPFFGLYGLWNIHSTWELPLKWKKVTSYMAKTMSPWIFLSPQTEVYPWAAFTPLGLNYSPRFARA